MKKKKNIDSMRELKKKTAIIVSRLRQGYPDATTALHYSSPLQLLIATILSAQCTDERVNMVTKELFRTYRKASDYANAKLREFEKAIQPTGFYRAKARSIINCCKVLVERYNGQIPESIEQLVSLPGVGRKTANVVLGNVYGKAEGIVVDTHVKRVSQRLGLTQQSQPEKIEKDLMHLIPRSHWITVGNILILHGRKICHARRPKCAQCTINSLCPSAVHSLP